MALNKLILNNIALFLLICFQLITFIAKSQQFDLRFTHLYNESGLSNNTITCIGQDKRGFMWFGSMNGLSKFNGYEIVPYYSDKNDPKAISGDYIQKIFNDKNQDTWFLTNEGIFIYNPDKDAFIKVKNFHGSDFALDARIFMLRDTIYVLSTLKGKFMKYDEKKVEMVELKDDKIYPDISQILWFRISKDMTYWNVLKNNTILSVNSKGKTVYKTQRIWSLTEDEEGNLYFGGTGRYYVYNIAEKEFSEIVFPEELGNVGIIWDIFCTKDRIWFGSEKGGLLTYLKENKKYYQSLTNRFNPTSISSNSVRSVYVDKQDNLWAGCWKGGVNYVNLYANNSFKNISQIGGKQNSLSGNIITSVYENKDGLLFVAIDHSGLNVFNRKTGEIEYFTHHSGNRNSLASYSATSLADWGNGIYYIACWGGFSIFDYNKKTFKSFYNDPNDSTSLPFNDMLYVLVTHDGKILVLPHDEGLFAFDPKNERFKRFTSVRKKFRISAFQDSKDNIWVSDYLGVYKFNKEGLLLKEFTSEDVPNTISSSWVNVVNEDSRGNIWIGTTYGLNKYDPKAETFKVYTTKNGLPSNTIFGILFDDNENLWLSTLNGLSKFNSTTEKFVNYDFNDGLQGNEFNVNAYFKNSKGEMFFGGTNGLTYFHPDSIFVNNKAPLIYLTDFKINYKEVKIGENGSPLNKHIGVTDSLVLTYKQSTFSISFVALNYINSAKNQYAYKLEGLDEDWNYVNKREALYTSIAPGNYVFKVKASNNDGVWNNEGVSLYIEILPPWWATFWFKSVVVILIVCIILIYIRWRIYRIKKRSIVLEKTVKERTQELVELNTVLNQNNDLLKDKQIKIEDQADELEMQKEELLRQKDILQRINEDLNKSNATKDKLFSIIAHDLRSPFNVLIGLSRLIVEKADELDMEEHRNYAGIMLNAAQNVYNLLDNLLLWARTQQEAIQFLPERFSLKELVNLTIETLNETANQKSVLLVARMDCDSNIIADRNMIRTVLHNLINNAIKFSYANNAVEIICEKDEGSWIISVKDNGAGIDEESKTKIFQNDMFSTKGTMGEKGSGLGLILCKEFIEAHNGKIWFESEIGKGTVFYFTIPHIEDEHVQLN